MEIIINTNQLDRLKSTYRSKYVDNSELYKGPRMCKGVNQNLNKLKIIDIIEQYGELVNEYQDIFKREKPIGECEDGSPIQLYTLNKTKTQKPIILIVGGVHGDEKTSIHGIYETVKFLLLGNKWSRFITSNFVVQIVPCLNVYGFNNNKRNNSNNKDLNRDFIKTTQKETKALTNYINKNKDRIKIILDSHNAYNEEFVSCKQEMKYFEEYEDVAFKLNLFLNGKYEADDKKSFLWISRSKNDGTLSDFINKNKFIGHTVESPRSLVKEIHYPNPVNYEDGAEVTKDLLVNLMYIYGKMYNDKLLSESKHNYGRTTLYENYVDELGAYHGSSYDFSNFSNKKINSGTGAQAYGWGIYLTLDRGEAQIYSQMSFEQNGGNKFVYDVDIPNGKYIDWFNTDAAMLEYILNKFCIYLMSYIQRRDLYKELVQMYQQGEIKNYSQLYQFMLECGISPKEISEYLYNECQIMGNKINNNYVMYNAQDITINNKELLKENYIDELQAYHGSQSDFDKFNHKKFLSTGAGSQIFGWGTYVTDDTAIAQSYANIDKDMLDSETSMSDREPNDQHSTRIVYEVEIPDDNGNNYIEWYEHFPKEYMERVLYGMASLKPKYIQMMCKNSYPFASHIGNYIQLKGHPNFNKIIQSIANEDEYRTFFAGDLYSNKKEGLGSEVYLMLQNYMGSAKAASLFLMQCGFDGIKYPTGTRMSKPNGANEDGLNYVIFDASKVKITNKTRIQ